MQGNVRSEPEMQGTLGSTEKRRPQEKLSHPSVMMSEGRARSRRTNVSRTYRIYKHKGTRCCNVTGKTSFRSTTAAWSFVDTRDEWRGEVSRVYRCEWCDWFHLTSKRTKWELARAAGTVAA